MINIKNLITLTKRQKIIGGVLLPISYCMAMIGGHYFTLRNAIKNRDEYDQLEKNAIMAQSTLKHFNNAYPTNQQKFDHFDKYLRELDHDFVEINRQAYTNKSGSEFKLLASKALELGYSSEVFYKNFYYQIDTEGPEVFSSIDSISKAQELILQDAAVKFEYNTQRVKALQNKTVWQILSPL